MPKRAKRSERSATRCRSSNPSYAANAHHQTDSGNSLVPEQIERSFDETHGGFGGAPKFPPHGKLQLLARSGDTQHVEVLTRTLDEMWQGGIHDHVGGGFHRYATDARWFLPHFEKMLYDNAQLIAAYAEAHRLIGEQRYARAVEDIFAWLSRERTHPDGGFYSALDSESEGEEGKDDVWSTEQLEEVLGAEDAKRFARIYGFDPEGNYTEEATGEKTGHHIPYLQRPLKQIASDEGVSAETLDSELAAMREKLRQAHSMTRAAWIRERRRSKSRSPSRPARTSDSCAVHAALSEAAPEAGLGGRAND